MPSATVRGVVSISIDAESGSSTVVDLLDRFHRHHLAATWVFSDPAGTPLAARRIACDMPGQEVALLAPLASGGVEVSRGDLAHTIVRRLQSAAAAGMPITSLAVTGHCDSRNVDLLTKQGITILRTDGVLADSLRAGSRQGISKLDGAGAHAICHGLWHVPVSLSLYGGGWLANRIQLARVMRRINRTAARGGLCHVRIEAAALAVGDVSQALRGVDRLLRHLDQLRRQHRIGVETLRDIAQRLLPKRAAAAHSILRAA